MNVPDNYIELSVLILAIGNENLGLTSKPEYRKCSIDMDCIYHFFDYGDGHTVLCNDYGQSVYIADITYNEFKRIFYEYKNSIITFDGKN
jgi:hypothetical protein